MKDRIIKFLTHESLTATKFADEIGVQRSSVSHILSGRNNPSFEFIQKILNRYRNLSAEWLLQGSGQMFKKAEGNTSVPPPIMPATNSGSEQQSDQLHLFNKTDINNLASGTDHKTINILPKTELLTAAKVDKIVVFYSDKTFDEFLPSK